MNKVFVILVPALLLVGCEEGGFQNSSTPEATMEDSETCRIMALEHVSHQHATLEMTGDVQISAFRQRYRACMAEKGYELPPPKP